MGKKKRLGKGLSALLNEEVEDIHVRQEQSGKNLISINEISLSKFQARKRFNQEKFSQLIAKKSDVQVINIKNKQDLKNYIKKNLFNNEMVICMGAGSISNWIREIGKTLK